MYTPEFQNLPLGREARGTINKEKTYRVRTGNGYFGTTLGRKYQDTMDYYTPANPQTDDQQANRGIFADAIAAAKVLTDEQKEPYRVKAKEEGGQSWISIFVREYMIEHS